MGAGSHGALDDATLTAATKDDSLGVRVHAQRVLSEREKWTADEPALALARAEGFRRGRAVGRPPTPSGRHPAAENIGRCWTCAQRGGRRHAPAARRPHGPAEPAERRGGVGRRPAEGLDGARRPADRRRGPGRPHAGVGRLPAEASGGSTRKPRDVVVNDVRHIARYGARKRQNRCWFLHAATPRGPRLQADLLKAIRGGAQERGAALDDDARGWAAELAGKLLASKQPQDVKAGAELAGQFKLEKEEAKVSALAADRGAAREPRGGPRRADGHRRRQDAPVAGDVLADAGGSDRASGGGGEAARPGQQAGDAGATFADIAVGPGPASDGHRRGAGGSKEGGEKLLEAVAAGKASARLLQEKAVETPLFGSTIPNVKDRVAKLTKGLPPADQKIQELLAARRKGFEAAKPDVEAGGQGVREELHDLPQAGQQGRQGGAAARRHRHPRPRPPAGGRARPEPQRRSGISA